VKRFADGGMDVVAAARRGPALDSLIQDIGGGERQIHAHPCDATREEDIRELFDFAERTAGPVGAVIYNAGAFQPARVADIEADDFERCWRVGCFGAFLVGREAARRMLPRNAGTLIFTGATAALRGGAGFANLAVPKFGLRALSQSLARELGPEGIHVAHVTIDGQILSERHAELAAQRPEDGLLHPDAIAENYWHLHNQHRSAWTQEMDLRPWVEKF
jgi:NAD(P)-dependent dehydrogenase (short-subunit alcohol dehydrogenase family)